MAGIHFMLPTPFNTNGRVNTTPLSALVDLAVSSGCVGIVALGVMGEAHRLSDIERNNVLKAVVEANKGRMMVTAGISSQSNHVVVERALEAEKLGATSVMACPPRFTKPNESQVFDYYSAINRATHLPIVVQDLPEQSGIQMSSEFISVLNNEISNVGHLKLEDPPTPPKITQVINATKGKMEIFGGLGGVFLFEELNRGASGTMTGFAYPEVLVSVYQKLQDGEKENARKIFYKWLPLIRYENSSGISLSIRKHIMAYRGLLTNPSIRPPTPAIDETSILELHDLLGAINLNKETL